MDRGGERERRATDVHRPAHPRSILDQRARVSAALRIPSHVAMGLLEVRPPRAARRWGAATVAAIAADAAYGRWLAADPDPHPLVRAAYEGAEGAAWALAGRADPITSRLPQIASVVPTAIEWGVRVGSGDVAVPHLAPDRPFPPEPGDRLRTIARLIGPAAAPHLAIRAVRRAKGWRWSPFEYIWPALAVGGGLAFGAYRQRLHREARTDWLERAQDQIAVEEASARAQAAIRESQGHHFKKNLVALAAHGSAPSRALAREQLEHPARVARGAPGATLHLAAAGIPIEPPERRDLWLGTAQCRLLDEFIDAVDESLEHTDPLAQLAPAVLRVRPGTGPAITIEYRGERVTLTNPPPRLRAALDPIPLTHAVTAIWKVLSWLSSDAQLPAFPSLALAGLDVATAVHQTSRRLRPELSPDRRVLVASVAAATAFNLLLFARPPSPVNSNGEPVFFGTSTSAAVLVVLGTYADQLGPIAWPVAMVTVAGWLLGAVGRTPRPARVVLIESMTLWQAYLGTRTMASNLAAEADLLEADLQREFAERVRAARLEAVRRELARFRRQVEVAERELAALAGELDPALAAQIDEECAAMRAWLEDPWTEHELAS